MTVSAKREITLRRVKKMKKIGIVLLLFVLAAGAAFAEDYWGYNVGYVLDKGTVNNSEFTTHSIGAMFDFYQFGKGNFGAFENIVLGAPASFKHELLESEFSMPSVKIGLLLGAAYKISLPKDMAIYVAAGPEISTTYVDASSSPNTWYFWYSGIGARADVKLAFKYLALGVSAGYDFLGWSEILYLQPAYFGNGLYWYEKARKTSGPEDYAVTTIQIYVQLLGPWLSQLQGKW
jgi:hypothetical protein